MDTKKTIYIGPSIQGLSTNTLFSGEYPPHIKDLIEARPALAGLIVPLEGLQQARQKMHGKGNVLNTYLQTLQKERK